MHKCTAVPGNELDTYVGHHAGVLHFLCEHVSGDRKCAEFESRLFKSALMDDEEETYRLWKIRKTIMQVCKPFCVHKSRLEVVYIKHVDIRSTEPCD